MKKLKIYFRNKMYPILWTIILLVAIYILIKFAALSFSDDMGQAPKSPKEAIASALFSTTMEAHSSLLSYTSRREKEAYAFPLNLVADEFALSEFTKNRTNAIARAQEKSSLSVFHNVDTEEESVEIESQQEAVGFSNIVSDVLSREYILTNGMLFNEKFMNYTLTGKPGTSEKLNIGYIDGEIDYRMIEEENTGGDFSSSVETIGGNGYIDYTMEQLKDMSFLIRNFYTVTSGTKATESLFDAEKLLSKDMTIKQTNDKPQILIYHTHSREAYADSRKGKKSDTVVGMGSYLKQILEERYGYNVIHDTTSYDNSSEDYLKCYNRAEVGLTRILEENPTIEVVIDLHRDSGENKTVLIEGEETAKIMLFHGLSRDLNGPLTNLDNPNLQDNLAFSLQLQLQAMNRYPGLFNKIFLREYRYNMHVRPKCLLVELGTWKNTVQAAKNALDPFAVVLNSVLQGEDTISSAK